MGAILGQGAGAAPTGAGKPGAPAAATGASFGSAVAPFALQGFGLLLDVGLGQLQKRERKRQEQRRQKAGVEITGSPSLDYSNIVIGTRLVEAGTVVGKGKWTIEGHSNTGHYAYVETVCWAVTGRGGAGGIKEIWLDGDRYRYPDDFENADYSHENFTGEDVPDNLKGIRKQINKDKNDAGKWSYNKDGAEPPAFLVTVYDGTQTTADPLLVHIGDQYNHWDEDYVGRQCVYTVMEFHRHKAAFQLWSQRGFPKIRVVMDGDKMPTTKAQAESKNPAADWEFSRNPVLEALYAGTELVDHPFLPAATRGDWADTLKYAAQCDELVARPLASTGDGNTPQAIDRVSFTGQPLLVTTGQRYAEFAPSSTTQVPEADWTTAAGTASLQSVRLYLNGQVELVLDQELTPYARRNKQITFAWIASISGDPPAVKTVQIEAELESYGTVTREGTSPNYSYRHSWEGEPHTDDWLTLGAATSVTVGIGLVPEDEQEANVQNAPEKRYEASVIVQGSATPAQIIEQLEFACDGDYGVKDGLWAMRLPEEDDSGVVVDEYQLPAKAGLSSCDPISERFTEIAGAFVDRNRNWKRALTPPLAPAGLEAIEGRKLPRLEVDLSAVTSLTQAWRLIWRIALRQYNQETLELPMLDDGLELRYGVNFKFESATLGIAAPKRFVVESMAIGRSEYPVVIRAREDSKLAYRLPLLTQYPVYNREGALTTNYNDPFPVGNLKAKGIIGGIEVSWQNPDALDEYAEVVVYDAPNASWTNVAADADGNKIPVWRGKGTTATIQYGDVPVERWFWAQVVVGVATSVRTPNDDITRVRAKSLAAYLTKPVDGDCPPEADWREGLTAEDPDTGYRWLGAPDPWPDAFTGTLDKATGVVTYDGTSTVLVKNHAIDRTPPTTLKQSRTTWTPKAKPDDLQNALIAIQGDVTVQVDRPGVLFETQALNYSYNAADNAMSIGPNPSLAVDDAFFADADNALFSSIDFGLTAGSENALLIFRDDNSGNYPAGPHLAKATDKYTVVLRIGTQWWALPIDDPDEQEPYALRTMPPNLLTVLNAQKDAIVAGTATSPAAIALVDEDQWKDGTHYDRAFTKVSATVRRQLVTAYSGTDATSPYVWNWHQAAGEPVPFETGGFAGTNLKVLELKQTERCWTRSMLSLWRLLFDGARQLRLDLEINGGSSVTDTPGFSGSRIPWAATMSGGARGTAKLVRSRIRVGDNWLTQSAFIEQQDGDTISGTIHAPYIPNDTVVAMSITVERGGYYDTDEHQVPYLTGAALSHANLSASPTTGITGGTTVVFVATWQGGSAPFTVQYSRQSVIQGNVFTEIATNVVDTPGRNTYDHTFPADLIVDGSSRLWRVSITSRSQTIYSHAVRITEASS